MTRAAFVEAVRRSLLAVPVAAAVGSLCALFLVALERATQLRFAHPWLLYLLPAGGLAIALMYHALGRSVERGTDLLLDEAHSHKHGVPLRMAPLIFVGTIVTHLFGGSAGREGTAVQMGGSVASAAARWLRLRPADARALLLIGMAAGFGGVFGTPLAAAVFAVEVLAVGRLEAISLLPCLVAGFVGELACAAWGVHHTAYHVALDPSGFHWLLAGKVAILAIASGLAAWLFIVAAHASRHAFKRFIALDALRPVVGGILVIALTFLVGTRDYLGIGIVSPEPHGVSITASFVESNASPASWALKTLFTAVTLGSGFKGGEVTPLFFIGATLGNTLAQLFAAPVDLFAAVGFVAVFAGATNTPLACTLMGMELFGVGHGPYLIIGCFLAQLVSGRRGIYASQRPGSYFFNEQRRKSADDAVAGAASL